MEENAYQQVDGVESDVDMDDLFGNNEDDLAQDDNENGNSYTPAVSTPAGPVKNGDDLNLIMGEGLMDTGDAEPSLNDAFLDELNARPLELGEKADDAEDFEDISDDDLPDEELASEGQELLPGLTDHAKGTVDFDNLGGDDDLFGDVDGEPTDSAPSALALPHPSAEDNDQSFALDMISDDGNAIVQTESDVADIMNEQDAKDWAIQRMLLEGGDLPETEEQNIEEIIKLHFPSYVKGQTPYFNQLFPPRPGKYLHAHQPPKRKPIRPTKVSLDIEQDQRMLFNSNATGAASDFRSDLVPAQLPKTKVVDEESSDESDLDEPLPGGVTMQDLEFMCADFDTLSAIAGSDTDMDDLHARAAESEIDVFGMDDFNDFQQPRKKRRTGMSAHDVVAIHQLDLPSFDNPERATAKLSEKVILDLNDAGLLVEEVDPDSIRTKLKPGEKTKDLNTVKSRLEDRFKISNDAEYDLLKQNHQHKIRGQLGHLTIDHSTPALRLQYPYYKYRDNLNIKGMAPDLRTFHRMKMVFKLPISFIRPSKQKRKDQKGKEFKDIYATTKHLSLADNSTAVLLEYSLENPLMMSQTGMGNKIVNYYRRKTKDDTYRPKKNLGETSVLLPEDKSPFYMFGHIDPGEETTALYNSMYRAPIFEQDMQPRDFLVVRESTGLGGQQHYMRNVDHLFVVGQELPSTAIPGTHSRMVTTASKNRLKAISWRIARRKKNHRIRVEDVTRHFEGSTDMQNRQKMKEFMFFNKEQKEWEMKGNEQIPDEDAVRALVRPEDVCLLESMFVGDRYLQDVGYAPEDEKEDDKEKEEEKENDDDSIEQLLAPWRSTKTFMQATQGKAMIRVWGIGDPSGRDEALSFIRINMKGGYQARGEPIADRLAKDNKPGSHKYNVAAQQGKYERDVRDTWNYQAASLRAKTEPGDPDTERDIDTMEDLWGRGSQRNTPVSTPAPIRHHDYETGTSFSKRSAGSQATKFLKITRTKTVKGETTTETFVETDPAIIKAYTKAKDAEEEDIE